MTHQKPLLLPKGTAIKELLRIDGAATQQAAGARLPAAQLRTACGGRLPAPWASVAAAHLAAAAQAGGGQLDAAAAAYNSDSAPHLVLVDAINDDPEDLALACAFERAMSNARQLAAAADAAAAAAGAKAGRMEQCGSQLQQAISRMGLPKGEHVPGKRRAHLALVCMLLRVYFKLNNIQGCTQVARTITNIYGRRGSDDIELGEFPAALRVTFFYFLGRTELYNENVELAARRLGACRVDVVGKEGVVGGDRDAAAAQCALGGREEEAWSPSSETQLSPQPPPLAATPRPPGAAGDALAATRRDADAHRRTILRYLVPCKMLLGELPSQELLRRHGLEEYAELRDAVAAGDVGAFQRALAERQFRLVRVGLYLLVDKLQVAAYRRCAGADVLFFCVGG